MNTFSVNLKNEVFMLLIKMWDFCLEIDVLFTIWFLLQISKRPC